jgi:SAM-dependent methyltransferase
MPGFDSEYRRLFDARGERYNQANRLFPEARAEEATRLLQHARIPARGRWLDLGAGGGFLAERAAAEGLRSPAVGCDESVAFFRTAAGYGLKAVADYSRLPFLDGGFAAVGCLAVLHHAGEGGRVIREMLRVTEPGGRAAVGDVAAGSRAASFLNGFVDAHTRTGHAGRFRSPSQLARLFEDAGGTGVHVEEVEVRWRFRERKDARAFFRDLFGLVAGTLEGEIDGALEDLGIQERERCEVPWTMVFGSADR